VTDFVFIFGAIAFVLTVTALASGLVERFPLSFPLIFFGLGSLLWKAAVLNSWRWPRSSFLEVVATLTLVSALILGSGTGLIIASGALPFGLFLNLG